MLLPGPRPSLPPSSFLPPSPPTRFYVRRIGRAFAPNPFLGVQASSFTIKLRRRSTNRTLEAGGGRSSRRTRGITSRALLLEPRSVRLCVLCRRGGQGYFQTRRVRLPRPADSWRGFGSGSRFDSRRRKEVLRAGPGSGARRRVCDTAVPSMSVLPRGACGTGAGVRTSPTPSPPSRDAEVDLHACCD